MRKSALLLAMVPALTVAVGAAPAGAATREPTSCATYRLPLPAHQTWGLVDSGSPDGRYLIGGTGNGSVLWHDRKIAAVVRQDGYPSAANNRGTVVGDTGGRDPRPAVLHGSTMTPLKGVAHGAAQGVNASGVIVGVRYDPHGPSAVVRWSSATAMPVVLAGPRGYSFVGQVAVTDGGTVVATLQTEISHRQIPKTITYVWPARGAAYRMPQPPAPNKPKVAEVIGVNGESVDWRVDIGGKHAYWTFRYDLRTRTYDVLPVTVDAQAVNLPGWAAGTANSPEAELQLQTPSHTIDLTPGWAVAARAAVVSDSGRTVAGTAWLSAKDTDSYPVVWDCL